MSYPQRFDSNRYENVPDSRSNNAASMQNNNYQGQFDSFQSQSHGSAPAQASYPNPTVHPSNMFFPPIDFSIPPPNFNTPVNVSTNHLPFHFNV